MRTRRKVEHASKKQKETHMGALMVVRNDTYIQIMADREAGEFATYKREHYRYAIVDMACGGQSPGRGLNN